MVEIKKPWSKLNNTLRGIIRKVTHFETKQVLTGWAADQSRLHLTPFYEERGTNNFQGESLNPYAESTKEDIKRYTKKRRENTVFGNRKPRKNGIRVG